MTTTQLEAFSVYGYPSETDLSERRIVSPGPAPSIRSIPESTTPKGLRGRSLLASCTKMQIRPPDASNAISPLRSEVFGFSTPTLRGVKIERIPGCTIIRLLSGSILSVALTESGAKCR